MKNESSTPEVNKAVTFTLDNLGVTLRQCQELQHYPNTLVKGRTILDHVKSTIIEKEFNKLFHYLNFKHHRVVRYRSGVDMLLHYAYDGQPYVLGSIKVELVWIDQAMDTKQLQNDVKYQVCQLLWVYDWTNQLEAREINRMPLNTYYVNHQD